MRHLNAEHVNRSRQQLISFIASFAVALTLFRFSVARLEQDRSTTS